MKKQIKRGFLLSMDALFAAGILLLLAAFLSSMTVTYDNPELEYQRLYYSAKDVMNVMQVAKLQSFVSYMPENFSYDCNLSSSDMDKTMLDVVGYLWAQNSSVLNDCADDLMKEFISRTLGNNSGYEVVMGGVNLTTVGVPGPYISRLHTIVSGYELGEPVSGYLASAYIARIAKSAKSYSYFGGYEGDGNITKRVSIPIDANVTEVYLEANMGGNFTMSVNGTIVGYYISSAQNFTADSWDICSDYASCSAYFDGGTNYVEFAFDDIDSSHVGGGFLKLTYNTSKPDTTGVFATTNETVVDNYWFPGIKGLMNLYSGFYIPGSLNNMSMYIRYDNNITVNGSGLPVFLYLGNTEVFRSEESGPVEIEINDSTLSGLFNYDSLSNATIPLRLGMETFLILAGISWNDVVLITDRSGSMGSSSCDVWSNSTPDCIPGTCSERCSVMCDDSQNVCENICHGTYTETTPGVFVCNGETDQCCDDSGICQQCGGTYGRRIRMNVAKDSDDDFIDTIMEIPGSRAGLVGYGTNMCSFHDLSYESSSLHDRIGSYDADCSATCICCGVNKATNMLIQSPFFDVINNSGFSGPSLGSWVTEGTVNLSSSGPVEQDNLEFDSSRGGMADLINISDTMFAVAYRGPDYDGWVKTFNVWSNGTISSVIESREFETGNVHSPDIVHVSGNVYAVAYEHDDTNDGWIKTFNIWPNGTIGSVIDSFEFDSSYGYYPDVVHVSGDYFAIAYGGYSTDGWVKTVDIDSSGNIGSVADSLEFNYYYCQYPDMIHVSGDYFAIAHSGYSNDGWVMTVDIDSSGNIGSVVDSLEFDSSYGNYPDIIHNAGDVYSIAYTGPGSDGWLKTVSISDSGSIGGSVIDMIEFDTSRGDTPSVVHISDNMYSVAYEGSGNDGWLKAMEIDDNGNIGDVIESLEFLNEDTQWTQMIPGPGQVYIIAYEHTSSADGWIETVQMGDEKFGLYDFWYVSSDHTSSGSVKQNFTMPTGELVDASIVFTHSSSDELFNGTALSGCNFTYPDSVGNMTTVILWSAFWDESNNTAGPATKIVDITAYLNQTTDPYANFTISCGSVVTAGGGTTVVAFDNIMTNMTLERYKAMLVMSDGIENRFCSDYDDYTGSYSGSVDSLDAACNARDNGIDAYAVAFGSGADQNTLKKIACWNCTTGDWIIGEGEDNCSRFYHSNNEEEIREMYREIANKMGQTTYEAQTISITGDVSLDNVLYSDSYIRYNYTPHNILEYGEVSISLESGIFGGNVTSPKQSSFDIPAGSRVIDAGVTSYSSEYWTSRLDVDTPLTSGWENVYNISQYGSEFSEVGDPFIVHVPVNLLSSGQTNDVLIDTALSDEYTTGGSPYDKVVYQVGVSGIVGYGNVFHDIGNATENATLRLQEKLSDFNITLLEVETFAQYIPQMPSLWGPSVMEIRLWD